MSAPGTPESPLAVAVVGAGPSGFYAVEALLKALGSAVRVDLFDRLPTPFGLVRGGVAPDHQKIKSVTAVYDKTAADPRVRFFGNVKLGRDLAVDDLRSRYHRIVYAVGCESDRHMKIPGEDLAGSHSATEFVGGTGADAFYGHSGHDTFVAGSLNNGVTKEDAESIFALLEFFANNVVAQLDALVADEYRRTGD